MRRLVREILPAAQELHGEGERLLLDQLCWSAIPPVWIYIRCPEGKGGGTQDCSRPGEELNELQSQFVSMASHKFHTPLALIDSTARRLKRATARKVSGDVTRRVDKILGAGERMTGLMESTLTAARLEEGKVAVQTEPCNIWKVLSDVCVRQREIAQDHSISCTTRGLIQTIKSDTDAIDQALANLLSNAVKYCPYNPEIEFEAFRDGDCVVVHVRDHGLDINPEDMPNMFSRFFRAETSSGIVGTGFGLNLVKTLVEIHGGSVSVESRRGQGSTFTIRLPIDAPAHNSKVA
jgi:signal transduction histidine kinase